MTMAHGAYRKPYDPANFITYAIAAFVTFVGLGFLLYFCFRRAGYYPLIFISAYIAFTLFVVCAVGFFLPPGSKINRLIHCEKTVLTFAVFLTLLLLMYVACNKYADMVFAVVLLVVLGLATVADIVVNLLAIKERTLVELFLFVLIAWACVIKLGVIKDVVTDFCFYMCIGGFSVYLVGTVLSSINAIKRRRLFNSFAVLIGTALNFVGIIFAL